MPDDLRALLVPTLLGLLAAAFIVGGVMLAGIAYGRAPGIPWMCDDTRYIDTVPSGRAVVGPAVSPPPGCGV